MLGISIMIANYFHDLAVAVLAVSVLSTFFVGRFLDGKSIRDVLLPHLFNRMKLVTLLALAYILVGGVFRAYFFMDYEWNPAVGRGQTAALIIKHVILIILTVMGLVIHLRYQKKYGIR